MYVTEKMTHLKCTSLVQNVVSIVQHDKKFKKSSPADPQKWNCEMVVIAMLLCLL